MKKMMLAASVLLLLWLAALLYFTREKPIMATCKDGTVSYSKHRSGTCSRHLGVLQFTKDAK